MTFDSVQRHVNSPCVIDSGWADLLSLAQRWANSIDKHFDFALPAGIPPNSVL
ncbi:hypothetical protein Pfra02_02480 [Pseudomonas fragi]|nr:hypothetical protein Pfra02_02480 [Pseudomonas fragi]